jgi:glutathione S-transferase
MDTVTIVGGPISPYARKVMAIADIKGVRWRADPIIPFQGNDEFTRVSPLRRIPVFIDDQVTLADSTAIGEYLDERYPTPPLFPAGPAARARARWLEEFADTRMGDVFIWRIFNPAVIVPGVWKQPRDDAAIAATLLDGLPSVMDYLESVAPEDGFVCGALAIADIAVAVFFANLRWSRTGAELATWPRTMAWIARVEQTAAIARLTTLAERSLTTRGAERRALHGEMGIELTETSFAGKGFRKGPMSV